MLEQQISLQLKKYLEIQNAFHTIKTKTTVTSPQMLLKKYYSYDQINQSLRDSICKYTKQHQVLIDRKKKLQNEHKKLQDQALEQDDRTQQQRKIYQNEKHILMTQISDKQLKNEKIINWVQRRTLNQQQLNEIPKINPQEIKYQFIQLCQNLCNQIAHYQQNNNIMCNKYISMGYRFKKNPRMISLQQQKQFRRQIQDMAEKNTIEEEYLHESRIVVKKKFLIKRKNLPSLSIL